MQPAAAMPPPLDRERRPSQHTIPPTTTSRTASTTTSRRASMLPPAARSPVMTALDGGVPLRHPRPLTAAELYLECEKEQEAVVNRLTRELTALRAQTASVASNASHSSASTGISHSMLPIDISDPNPTHQMVGPTHPTPRRDRSSSSVSNRSNQPSAVGTSLPRQQSQVSLSRAPAQQLSRQNSISGTSTPARHSLDLSRQPSHTQRPAISRPPSQTALWTAASSSRAELEAVKAENEALRQRVRALERALGEQRRGSVTTLPPEPSLAAGGRLRRDSSLERSTSRWAAGVNQASAAAYDGGVGGVAGPRRDRSESRSTTASALRGGLVAGGQMASPPEGEVSVAETAAAMGRSLSAREERER